MQSEKNKINENVWCHVLIQMVHAKDFFVWGGEVFKEIGSGCE